jgi:2-polyprenyl-6-methoxyphenol hydroxylase-like FAD-dependent oxidoreductase
VYEGVLRRAVLDQPGVDLIAGDRVTQLVARPGVPPVVCGVRTEQGLEIAAPIVIDATGRRSQMPEWVREHGVAELPTTTEPIGLQYYTRFYRLHDGEEFPATPAPIVARLRYLNALAFPCDNRTFSLTLACFVDDPFRRALANPGAFERVLMSIPVTAPWVQAGEAISPVHAMARIENRWQRLIDAGDAPLVGGVVLAGDSSMHTNPTFGRGVSLAFAQAQRLATTLASNGDTTAYTAEFERWTAQQHGDWFNVQAAYDRNLVDTFQASLRGDPEPEPNETSRFFRAMVAAADTDDIAALAMTRFVHLLRKPSEIFSDEDLNQRVRAYMATHELTMFDNGPTRTEFEAIVAAA